MDLQHWQAQFENWLKNHHQHQDAAHDVCHFRRVWATAQKLAADDDVDMLDDVHMLQGQEDLLPAVGHRPVVREMGGAGVQHHRIRHITHCSLPPLRC